MNKILAIVGLENYQWLLQELIKRDLKVKYRNSVLGYLWSILNPLMMMGILTIVFSSVFRFDVPNYPVYLLAGQLLYNFYAEATSMAMESIVNGASLIRKVYLPKYIFPVSRVLSSFVTMLLSLIALVVVMMVTGCSFHITVILIPIVFAYILIFSLGIGLIVSVAVVFFRDVRHLYGVFLTGFMYLTPIFYPVSIIPKYAKPFIEANPMFHFISMFRDVAIYGKWPTVIDHFICFAFAMVALSLGLYVFKKNERDFILYI